MTEIACSSNSLMFDGIFQGREREIRITPDRKWVSAIDVISVVGGQKNPKSVWERIKNSVSEVVAFCDRVKFSGPGQKDTPVINAKGLVILLQHIPGDLARQFR